MTIDWLNKIGFKKQRASEVGCATVQTARRNSTHDDIQARTMTIAAQTKLYDTLRQSIPVIDAAIAKTVRLVGGYAVECESSAAQKLLDRFTNAVNVNGNAIGLEAFVNSYLDSLLTYGTAVGEIVLDKNGCNIVGLYNAKLSDVLLKSGASPLDVQIFVQNGDEAHPVARPEMVMHTSLNAKTAEVYGCSIMEGLPFVSSTLLKVYESIAQNFERIGNIRYAVTYKPGGDTVDKAFAKERAMQIANEWSNGMVAAKNGVITDFVSVGDVSIKVIGADNQLIDTNVPVRQMLEQIVAKLGIPPFLLGLNWNSTERMSKQQCDILTSELDYYRRLLTPIILRVCTVYLRMNGFDEHPTLSWKVINLQDEAEQAQSALYQAQAEQIRHEIGKE